MDSATEDLHFQKFEEFIQDDDKIVTVPYISKTLNLNVQHAQNLLSKYVKDQRKLKPNELAVTYVLTGTLIDKGKGVIFVKENNLKEKRALFDKIESEVLFSVQKCKEIDFNVISLVDDVTSGSESMLLGSIVGKNCVKRILKVKKLPTPPPSTVRGKSSFFLPKTQSASNVEKSKPSESKSEPSESKTEPKTKQNGIAGMFSKVAASQASKEKDSIQKSVSNTSNKSKGGLTGFLSRGSSTSSVKSQNGIKKVNSMTSNTESQPSELEELMEVDFYEVDDNSINTDKDKKIDKEEQKETNKKEAKKEVIEDTKETNKKGVRKSEVKEKRNKNKRQREKSEEKNTKKRKRIVERNDSESDDMFESDVEDIIERSDDEPERSPSPVTKKPLAPKNKMRKAVDKTYMDEEGFIVTKTEYVYESAPEDEEVVPVKEEKEEIKPKLEKKTSASSENDISPQKGAKNKKGKKNNLQNQPTLMNFFKKK